MFIVGSFPAHWVNRKLEENEKKYAMLRLYLSKRGKTNSIENCFGNSLKVFIIGFNVSGTLSRILKESDRFLIRLSAHSTIYQYQL